MSCLCMNGFSFNVGRPGGSPAMEGNLYGPGIGARVTAVVLLGMKILWFLRFYIDSGEKAGPILGGEPPESRAVSKLH